MADQVRPVIFGEVLFDVFPDAEVIGGACFNVAWNLQGLGLDPLMITRVGDDERGERVSESMESWGMELSGVQVDGERPTGVVEVSLEQGQPSYEIVANQAYDAIDAAAAESAVESVSSGLLYHGTLAIRDEISRAALSALRPLYPIFVDVNLRTPWWTAARVERSLREARWAKLNDDEIAELAGVDSLAEHEMETRAFELRRRYGLDELIVTLGENGALLVREKENLECTPPPVSGIVDTVGAGDAFCAVMILGIIRGWPEPVRLRRAVSFAGAVCRRRGACSRDATDYVRFVEEWAAEDV